MMEAISTVALWVRRVWMKGGRVVEGGRMKEVEMMKGSPKM